MGRNFAFTVLAVLYGTTTPPACLTLELIRAALSARTRTLCWPISQPSACGSRSKTSVLGWLVLGLPSSISVDVLEVDQSFVVVIASGTAAVAIIQAVTRLAYDLGLIVIAEASRPTSNTKPLPSRLRPSSRFSVRSSMSAAALYRRLNTSRGWPIIVTPNLPDTRSQELASPRPSPSTGSHELLRPACRPHWGIENDESAV